MSILNICIFMCVYLDSPATRTRSQISTKTYLTTLSTQSLYTHYLKNGCGVKHGVAMNLKRRYVDMVIYVVMYCGHVCFILSFMCRIKCQENVIFPTFWEYSVCVIYVFYDDKQPFTIFQLNRDDSGPNILRIFSVCDLCIFYDDK